MLAALFPDREPPSRHRCGVVLHPSALPGPGGCGGFGIEAAGWIRRLGSHGVGVWQVLPLAPTDGTGSPYSSPSSFALNPWFLDGPDLVQQGLLSPRDICSLPDAGGERLEPQAQQLRAEAVRGRLLAGWPERQAQHGRAFQTWRRRNDFWLRDHCRFVVLRQAFGGAPWWQWPDPLAQRSPRAVRKLDRSKRSALLGEALMQWCLDEQWGRLRRLADRQGVEILGDLPFYVAHDSADVWSQRGLFTAQGDGSLTQQSGVPPDYFSATGQLWGTPVYRWAVHRLTGFRWWRRRVLRQLQLVDSLRIDHFRALSAYWSVPGGDDTAMFGRWVPSPGANLLSALKGCHFGSREPLPLVAEDLGVITPDVEALRDRFGLPGMKVLQFAFDGYPDNPYLPANIHGDHWVVYTGTHDNPTCLGWWAGLDDRTRHQVATVVGDGVDAPGWQLLELGLRSSARLVMVPLQDLLQLDDRARFNTPGTCQGNWSWRTHSTDEALDGAIKGLGERARASSRC